ncbi:MAG: hypothetical protein AAF950_11295 [Pseudomonadota bacterium]
MRKLVLATTILAALSLPKANAQVINCGPDNRIAGTAIGAIVGGTAGGVIANNIRRDVFIGRRGFYGRGFRRGRFVTRRGNQGLGIALGALAGGLIGNQVAAQNTRPCPSVIATPSQRFGDPFARPLQGVQTHHTTHIVADGPIDLNAVRYGDPFGGRPVIRTQNPPVNTQQRGNLSGGPSSLPQGVFEPQCQTVFQTTELPDGTNSRQPIEVCQYSEGGEWIPTS